MRNLVTKHLLVVGFVLVLINPMGGSDACLADPTGEHPSLSSIPPPPEEADIAADKGKTNLIKLIQNDPNRAASIGFSSAEEVTSDKINRGSGIPVIKIIAKSLFDKPDFKNMSSYFGSDPLNQFMYPIIVDGKARTGIYVQKLKKTGQWKAVSFGAPGLVAALEELKLLGRDGVFISRYDPLGIWLVCAGLDDKSQCHKITANPKAFDYKSKNKVWPNRPIKGGPNGETVAPDTGAEAGRAGPYVGLGGAEPPGARAETGPGRADPLGIRPEVGLGRDEAPPAPLIGIRVEGADDARAEVGASADKKEEVPLVIIQKEENGPAVLRNLADQTRKLPSLDDKTYRLKNR